MIVEAAVPGKGKGKAARKQGPGGQWAAPASAVSLAQGPWDHGAEGAANREGLVVEERGERDPVTGRVRNPNRVTGVRRVDMLEVYYRRGQISARGFAAGEALREAWLRTEVGRCAPWLRDRVDSSTNADAAVTIVVERITSLLRLTRLIAAEDAALIHTVVALGVGVAQMRRYRGSRHRDGMEHLRAALDRLADRVEGG